MNKLVRKIQLYNRDSEDQRLPRSLRLIFGNLYRNAIDIMCIPSPTVTGIIQKKL